MTDVSLITVYHVRPQPLADNGTVCMAGMPSLLPSLRQAGFEAEHLPYFVSWETVDGHDVRRLVDTLDRCRGDVVGVGCLGLALPLVIEALRRWTARAGRRVVLGGYGPSDCAALLLRDFPFVDAVVRGEAESSLPSLVRWWRDGGDAPSGVTLREVVTGPVPRAIHPDQIPEPDYAAAGIDDFDAAAVLLHRGCPHACSYCAIGEWTPTLASHEAHRTVAVMAALRARGVSRVIMADDTFNATPRRCLEFCSALESARLGLSWNAFVRVHPLSDELLAAMARAGCSQVLIGVDTVAERLLRLHKGGGYDEASARDAIWRAADHMASVMPMFLFGFPDETWTEFTQSVRFILELMEGDPLGRVRIEIQPVWPYASTRLGRHSRVRFLDSPRDHAPPYRRGLATFAALYRAHPYLGPLYQAFESPHLEAKRRLAAALWSVLAEGASLDDFHRRHGPDLHRSEPRPRRRLFGLTG